MEASGVRWSGAGDGACKFLCLKSIPDKENTYREGIPMACAACGYSSSRALLDATLLTVRARKHKRRGCVVLILPTILRGQSPARAGMQTLQKWRPRLPVP